MRRAAKKEPLLPRIARWASEPDLVPPPAVAREARLAILDTLACVLAGLGDPAVGRLAEALGRSGAAGPVATLRPGLALDAAGTALFHGFAAHVLDFDDYEAPASTHPSAALVPALLALSDLKPVTLGEILTAYAVGYETINRVGLALGGYRHYARGWHSTATLGPIGAAAAAARLLRLPEPAFAAALALATSSSAGLKRQFGSDAKPLHAGLAARNGLEAALLAEAGLQGKPDVTEGPFGFLACYGDPSEAGSVGRPWALETAPILRKPWPSCAYTHRSIEAALVLAAEPAFACEDLAAVGISIPEPYYRVASFGIPKNPPEARFSLPYCVAVALKSGDPRPEDFTEAAIRRGPLLSLAEQVTVEPYDTGPDLEDMSPAAPDRVTLTFKTGVSRARSVGAVKGGPANPMSAEDLLTKFVRSGGSAPFAGRFLEAPADRAWRFGEEVSAIRTDG